MSTVTGPLVRPATPADADAMGEIHIRSWQHAYAGLLPDELLAGFSVPNRQRAWRDRLTALAGTDRPDRHMFVAVADGEVVGFTSVGVNRDADADQHTGELYSIYLRPDRQGRGIGRLLNDRGLAALAADGYRAATLWVLAGNSHAQGFYQRMGWAADGATKTEPVVEGAVPVTEARYRIPLSTGETRGG
ncbi:MAG TPA: GNAT family N-acetyltransferase [Pseudonocardiaceae bacterium]|nr:GNAT family N-acetyltransferase [Pseudonocardiaceae bacterium]